MHDHSTILGHSRYRVYCASFKVKQSDVFEALEESFREFEIIYDGGLRYDKLEAVAGKRDWLKEIMAPRVSE